MLIIFCFYNFVFIYFKSSLLVELTGMLSAICECFIPIPQFLKNRKMKSVKSLSFIMIMFWALGDSMKFLFYLMRS